MKNEEESVIYTLDGITVGYPQHNRVYICGRDVTDYKTWKEFEQIVTAQSKQIRSLEEQLKNAIVLPIGYGLGQIVYMIPTKTNALKKTCAYRIINFSKSEIGCRVDLSLITKEKGVEALYCAGFDMFGECIFPNLGLAEEKRLAELKGEGK